VQSIYRSHAPFLRVGQFSGPQIYWTRWSAR